MDAPKMTTPPSRLPAVEASGRLRVLAVDDQRDALRLLELRLQTAGMDCFAFSDGLAALDFLSRESVDVILLDIMLPRMDGFEVCRRLKSNPQTRDIPVIFLTARLGTEDKIRGLEAGGHDYVSKPINTEELLARTRAAVRAKRLQDELKKKLELQQQVAILQQEKLSEHWQKTLGQLAASLAHEINNPLAVALGSVQLLAMEEELAPEFQERLRVVDASLQRAAQKLRSLLLIAQTNRVPEAIRLSQLIEDVVALINYEAVVNKVQIETHLDSSSAWIGAAGELARALLYIINNSIEACAGRAGNRIRIKLESAGDQQIIRISDNGPGIPADIADSIFEPFFTTKPTPHNGVGLFLAQQILQNVKGFARLEKNPSFGTTEFILSLPLLPM